MSVHEVDCLLESMNSVLELLGDLDDSDWQARSLCPAWRVRQVVAHLDGIEEALSDSRPAGADPAPFEIVGKVFDEVDDWPPDRLLGRFRAVVAAAGASCSPQTRACSTKCRGLPSGSRPSSWKGKPSYYTALVDEKRNAEATWYHPHPSPAASRPLPAGSGSGGARR